MRCPTDGGLLTTRSAPNGYVAAGECPKCHLQYVMDVNRVISQDFSSIGFIPDFMRRTLRDLETLVSSSSGVVTKAVDVEDELRALAGRVEGEIQDQINRAADDARAAADQARGAVGGVRIIQDRLRALQTSFTDSGVLDLPAQVAELRRQIREHIDHHG